MKDYGIVIRLTGSLFSSRCRTSAGPYLLWFPGNSNGCSRHSSNLESSSDRQIEAQDLWRSYEENGDSSSVYVAAGGDGCGAIECTCAGGHGSYGEVGNNSGNLQQQGGGSLSWETYRS